MQVKNPNIRCFVANCICRDVRAFSGIKFPAFGSSLNMFATTQSLEHR